MTDTRTVRAPLDDRRLAGRLGAVGLGAIAGAAIYLRDPAKGLPFPPCPFHAVTGLDCPFCGTGRALHQLLHGHVHQAFSLNPLVVALVPVALVAGASFFGLLRIKVPRWLPVASLVVVLAFTVARNLPFGPLHWMSAFH